MSNVPCLRKIHSIVLTKSTYIHQPFLTYAILNVSYIVILIRKIITRRRKTKKEEEKDEEKEEEEEEEEEKEEEEGGEEEEANKIMLRNVA